MGTSAATGKGQYEGMDPILILLIIVAVLAMLLAVLLILEIRRR